ncbi:hypothetical protein L9F63_020702, partial [Diploptera punctata]
ENCTKLSVKNQRCRFSAANYLTKVKRLNTFKGARSGKDIGTSLFVIASNVESPNSPTTSGLHFRFTIREKQILEFQRSGVAARRFKWVPSEHARHFKRVSNGCCPIHGQVIRIFSNNTNIRVLTINTRCHKIGSHIVLESVKRQFIKIAFQI